MKHLTALRALSQSASPAATSGRDFLHQLPHRAIRAPEEERHAQRLAPFASQFHAIVAAIAAVGLGLSLPSAGTPNDDVSSAQANQDTSSALVQLNGDPLSTYVRTKPPQGKKIDFSSNTVKSYRAQLSALRNDYKQWLKANVPQAKVTGEFDISLNAVAVQLNGATLA
jgi:hypothetical protein